MFLDLQNIAAVPFFFPLPSRLMHSFNTFDIPARPGRARVDIWYSRLFSTQN